jgi:Tfp pilus assembly protein PilN
MLNIIKTLFTSSIFLVSSNIQSTKEFSLFWMVVGFFSLACQLIVLLTFRFADVIVKDKGKGGQQDLEMKLIDNNAK